MKRSRCAFSLVEVLMALSITAVLMTAVFQALVASANGLRTNQSQAMLTMRGRTVMMRMLDHIRATAAHEPQDPAKKTTFQASSSPVDDTGIVLSDQSSGAIIIYTYWLDATNPANPQLKMTRQAGSTTTTNVLLNGVTSFNVRMWPGRSDPINGTFNDILLKAAITLTGQEQNKGQATGYRITGTNTIPDTIALSGSSAPRQNAWSGQKLYYSIDKILTQNH